MGNQFCNGVLPSGSSQLLDENKIDVKSLMIHRAKSRRYPFDGDGASSPSNGTATFGQTDGELLIFLESVHHVPFRGWPAGVNCGAPSGEAIKSYGRPSVRAWAEEGGVRIGKEVSWPAKKCNGSPVWFSAKPLGFSIAKHENAMLHMEVLDQGVPLGSFTTPLSGLPPHCVVRRELDAKVARGSQQAIVTFQALDAKRLMGRRSVFFVRHGESVWNRAQSKLQLHEMARTTDHPLTKKGRDQAEGLCRRLGMVRETGEDSSAEGMLHPDVVYISPLTRAVQTAIIGLGPVLTQSGTSPVEMVLMANAREKQNFGGLDTQSTKLGSLIVQNTLEETYSLYTGASEGAAEAILDAFSKLRFDAEEVLDSWWCDTPLESSAQLKVRMHEFMCQLAFSPHRTIVVVGHSHFFREIMKTYISEEFRTKNKDFAKDLSTGKLMNCGVVRVDLDPHAFAADAACLVDAELVLDTTLVKEENPCQNPCQSMCTCGATGPYTSETGEILPDVGQNYEVVPSSDGGGGFPSAEGTQVTNPPM